VVFVAGVSGRPREERRRSEMTQYLIAFDDGDMIFPEEDLPDVAKAAQAVVQEAREARSRSSSSYPTRPLGEEQAEA
jgi:hypothetical protein